MWYDYLIILTLSVLCIAFFAPTTDLWNTAESSMAYLNGHFLDFYEVNAKIFKGSDYYPFLYLIFAVWNLPLRLFSVSRIAYGSFALMTYEKLLPSLFMFLGIFPVYQITRALGRSARVSVYAAFLYVTSSTMFVATLCWGMYDTILVFFVLAGFYFFIQEKTKYDALIAMLLFGIAFAMKMYTMIILIPLLAYRYKNVLKLAGCALVSVAPVAVFRAVYAGSAAFNRQTGNASDFTMRFFIPNFGYNGYRISLFCFAYLTVCFIIYATHYDPDDKVKTVYMLLPACAAFYCFVSWNPQWFTLIVPFLAITTAISARRATYILLDILLGFAYILHTLSLWKQFGSKLVKLSDLGRYLPGGRSPSKLHTLLSAPCGSMFYTSLIAAVLAASCILKDPFRHGGQYEREDGLLCRDKAYLYLRFFLGVGFYTVGMLVWYMIK